MNKNKSPLPHSSLGGAPMAAVRALAVLAPGTAGAERLILHVLCAAVCACAGVRVAPAPAAAHHAEGVAAACALVAMRSCAARGMYLLLLL